MVFFYCDFATSRLKLPLARWASKDYYIAGLGRYIAKADCSGRAKCECYTWINMKARIHLALIVYVAGMSIPEMVLILIGLRIHITMQSGEGDGNLPVFAIRRLLVDDLEGGLIGALLRAQRSG